MRVLSIVGARPNFMKLAPVDRELVRRGDVEHVIVHTGQHYDADMSDTFFEELRIPRPDHHLGVGSASHAAQTAAVMQRLEPVLHDLRPDLILVYGDVNSTLAAALVAAKLGLRIGHVEAGLRSGDWTMPEEINRVLTDRLSDLLFAPSRDAVENLRHEGIPAQRTHVVGNVMIDSLVAMLPAARALDAPARHGVVPGSYVVATLHRPSNVDDAATLRCVLEALDALGADGPVIFPVHPRTHERIRGLAFEPSRTSDVRLLEPLGYLEILSLVASAKLVITDSGGLQEETTYLGVPCLTVRPNTERPITCRLGTNRLVAARRDAILAAARDGAEIRARPRVPIERWDGRAAERIVQVVCDATRFE
jgi:UDP-N-acetylglucosamine 2-epimerase (non-hydrolysing)